MQDFSARQSDATLKFTDADSNAVLLINDFNLSDKYAELIDKNVQFSFCSSPCGGHYRLGFCGRRMARRSQRCHQKR